MYEFIKRFSAAWVFSLVLLALLVIIFDDPYGDLEGIVNLFVSALLMTIISYLIDAYEKRGNKR